MSLQFPHPVQDVEVHHENDEQDEVERDVPEYEPDSASEPNPLAVFILTPDPAPRARFTVIVINEGDPVEGEGDEKYECNVEFLECLDLTEKDHVEEEAAGDARDGDECRPGGGLVCKRHKHTEWVQSVVVVCPAQSRQPLESEDHREGVEEDGDAEIEDEALDEEEVLL